jgi:AraC-like DNA-binding protein
MHGHGIGQTRQPTTSEFGLLDGTGPDYQLRRMAPAAELSSLVERHWLVSWDLAPGHRSAATLLPHPCVNLFFVAGSTMIAGVGQERFSYPLSGRGRVFGVKFRPGGFLPLLGSPVAALTGRTVPASTLWPDADQLTDALRGAGGSPGHLVSQAESFLRRHWPAPDPEVARVGLIVQAILNDRTITRVDDVGVRFGLSTRSLQRLFQRYVGVSPKWVLRRYRLHEAAARLADQPTSSWSEVAAELGYFDQSHFIRDFVSAVGVTPAEYSAACREGCRPTVAA